MLMVIDVSINHDKHLTSFPPFGFFAAFVIFVVQQCLARQSHPAVFVAG